MSDAINHQYLSFFVGGDEVGLPILRVREIVEYAPITRMPSMPPAVRGVTNLRGQVVPVVDLGAHFGFGPTPITQWTCIVMIEADAAGEKGIVGLLAERVSQVVELGPSEIEPVPAFGTRVRAEVLSGMGKLGPKFLLILDVDKLLASPELLEGPGRSGAEGAREQGALAPAPAPASQAA